MEYAKRIYPDAFAFLADCEEHLLEYEVEHSLILGIASNLARGLMTADEETFFGSVWRGGRIQGAYLRSGRGRALLLSRMPEAAATWLASHLEREVDECQGPARVAKQFAEVFGLVRSKGFEVEMFQGVYRLDGVDGHYPFEAEGLVEASSLDREMLRRLVEGFMEECFPALDSEARSKQTQEILERHLKQRALFAWRNADSEIVAIAARSRESLRGATISLVYTPPEHRRKGYAGRLVAALSRRVLEGGKNFCMLYTDLKNPTSNSVYRKVGYRQIGESLHCRFWERRD
jgi:uncharacterized protein